MFVISRRVSLVGVENLKTWWFFYFYLFSYPQRGALKCMTSSDLKSMLTVGILLCSGASALKKCLISSRLKREHFMSCLISYIYIEGLTLNKNLGTFLSKWPEKNWLFQNTYHTLSGSQNGLKWHFCCLQDQNLDPKMCFFWPF